MKYPVSYTILSPMLLEIRWPEQIDKDMLLDMLWLKQKIWDRWGKDLWDIRTGYHTVCLKFRSKLDQSAIITEINALREKGNGSFELDRKRWTIPVLYEGKDLEKVAEIHEMEVEEVIRLHKEPNYVIHFFGFLPGFMYLGGLNEQLHTPRKEHPDPKIEAGSVAIGGQQTGIYPMDSPGGWYVIGTSPVRLFELTKKPPILLKVGDEVRFESVSQEKMAEIQKEITENTFTLSNESI